MLKKTVTYETFDGEKVTEDFYFNLTETELTDWSVSKSGGMVQFIKILLKTSDGAEMYKMIKDLVLKSYGIKSPDGKKFYKSDAIIKEFESSAAFSDIMTSIMKDEKSATDFIKGVIPKKLAAKVPEGPVDMGAFITASGHGDIAKLVGSTEK
jgi:transcriptional regulator NrdR family protein